jgi:predicted RND superfamily exporter protein
MELNTEAVDSIPIMFGSEVVLEIRPSTTEAMEKLKSVIEKNYAKIFGLKPPKKPLTEEQKRKLREYAQKRKEVINQNPEKFRESRRLYYLANKKNMNESSRRYFQANRERITSSKKDYFIEYYKNEAHRERRREIHRRYRARKKEELMAKKIAQNSEANENDT